MQPDRVAANPETPPVATRPASLVNCVAYRDGRKVADVAIADISDYLQRPDTFVWVALRDAGLPARKSQRYERWTYPILT